MSPGKGTPPKALRVHPDLWRAAKEKAAAEGTTVSDHIRDELADWTGWVKPQADIDPE